MGLTVEQQLKNVDKTLNKIYTMLRSLGIKPPEEVMLVQWVSYTDTMKLLNRSRSTIEKFYLGNDPILIYKIDWIREGNRIKFNMTAIEKMKNHLQITGDVLTTKLAAR